MKIQTILKSFFIICCWMIIGVSCGPDCDNNRNYVITAYSVAEYEGGKDPVTGDIFISPLYSDELKSSDTVYYKYVGYQLTPATQLVSIKTNNFFNNAMADECIGPDPSQKYSGVTIVSNQAFITSSKTYNAGENLTEIFSVVNSETFTVGQALLGYFAFESGFMLILKAAPSGIQQHKFTFTISLDDGSDFSASTETLAITPTP